MIPCPLINSNSISHKPYPGRLNVTTSTVSPSVSQVASGGSEMAVGTAIITAERAEECKQCKRVNGRFSCSAHSADIEGTQH